MKKNSLFSRSIMLSIIVICLIFGISYYQYNSASISVDVPLFLDISASTSHSSSSNNYKTTSYQNDYKDIDEFFNSDEIVTYVILIIAMAAIPMIITILMFIFIIKIIITSIRRGMNCKYFRNNVVNTGAYNGDTTLVKNRYVDVKKDKLAMFNTDDINSLKKYFYDMFEKFEKSYNNLDYNIMKSLSTKQLYNNYYTGIKLDLNAGKKRIIEDIKKEKVVIYELDSTTIKQTASLYIEVSYINYIIDRSGKVISGSREDPMKEKFEVTFRKDFEKNDVTKCPNCGANVGGNICEYCRTPLNVSEFRISNIKRIID